MARHSGKNLKIMHGANSIDGCQSFDFDESISDVDLTAAGDGWEDHDTTQGAWTGTISMLKDDDAAANQTLSVGDVITVSGYTKDDGTGSSYLTGSCSVVGVKASSSYNGQATREYSLKGKGALATEVVV